MQKVLSWTRSESSSHHYRTIYFTFVHWNVCRLKCQLSNSPLLLQTLKWYQLSLLCINCIHIRQPRLANRANVHLCPSSVHHSGWPVWLETVANWFLKGMAVYLSERSKVIIIFLEAIR